MPHIENPSTQNPLALAGREKRVRTSTQTTKTQGVRTAARDVVPDSENATICRDSRARVRVRSPHVPSCKCCNRVFHRTGKVRAGHAVKNRCHAALTGIAARLRCLRAPPEKAAVLFSLPGLRSVSANARIAAGSNSQVKHRHEQQRHVASASRLRPGRSRLFERRRLLAHRHQWRPLSRFHLRCRGQRARPLPSRAGGRPAGAGDQTLAHVEPVQEPGRRQAGRAVVRGELCRLRVLLQFRCGSDGRRHQAGAPLSFLERRPRAQSHHHLRRRVPRPHLGDARGHRLGKISRRLRSGDGRFRPGAAWRPRSRQESHRPAHRRHPDRAGAGRGRRAHRAGVVLQGAAPALRRAWPAARLRRGADRHGPLWRSLCLSPPRRDARHHVAGQSARRRFPDRRGAGERGSGQGHGARLARLDFRRQSARGRSRQCRARRHAQARLLRSRAEDVAA